MTDIHKNRPIVKVTGTGRHIFYLLTACEQRRESCLFLLLTAGVSYWFTQGPMKEEDVFPGTVYPLLGKLLFFLPDRYKQKLCCTGQGVSNDAATEPRRFGPAGYGSQPPSNADHFRLTRG